MNSLLICSPIFSPSDKYIKIFKDWIDWINEIEENKLQIYWLIQINKINENDKNEIKKIIDNKNIITIFFEYELVNDLSFYKEFSQNIISFITTNKLINEKYILWLENDWILNKQNLNINSIIYNYIFEKTYFSFINLKKNIICELSPFICNFKLWFNLFYKSWIKVKIENKIEAKYYIGLNFEKIMKNNKIFNFTIILKNKDVNYFDKIKNEQNSYYTYLSNYSSEKIINEKFFDLNNLYQFKDEYLILKFNSNLSINYNELNKKVNLKKNINNLIVENKNINYEVYTPNIEYNIDGLKVGNKYNNILFLCDKNIFLSKMSRVRFNAMTALNNIHNVIYWGPNWINYDKEISVEKNIKLLKIKIDFIIFYKPEILKNIKNIKIPKIITYNEMWDEKLTINEINNSHPDLIICHHKNDFNKYINEYFKELTYPSKFVYIPHSAEKTIFYDMLKNREIDILLCGALGRHYPLRNRYQEIIKKIPKKYICKIHEHPGYNYQDSYTNKYLKEFAEDINNAKICLTCTSKYKYRLGKIVEIPMCGAVLACDLPECDEIEEKELKEIMIEIDERMTDDEIINKLIYYLENKDKLFELKEKGLEWSKKYTQENYAIKFNNELKLLPNKSYTIFILGDELKNSKVKWICDILKDEFINFSGYNFTLNPNNADIIWLLAPWNHRKIKEELLKKKFVITTIHHIDWEKYEEFKYYYEYIDKVTNSYHVICDKTKEDLKKLTKKEIIIKNFWINQNNYYRMKNIKRLKDKYELDENYYLIGSFQKDTEGKDESLPKYSKGPDIFLKIVEDISKSKKIMIILTGWRRTYLMKELDKLKIKYKYFEMLETYQINELYNCLDLYIVSSRVEGGPRSIIECAIAKVPIISTNVGISNNILHPNSIYDMNNFLTYKFALDNIVEKTIYAYNNVQKYMITEYIEEFKRDIFSFMR